jgi:hypothetical protein
MTLVLISIPLMILAVAIAAVPLILMSSAEHRRRMAEIVPPFEPVSESSQFDDRATPIAA